MNEPQRNRTNGGPDSFSKIERMLESALAPVEPPASLVDELELKLADVQAAAIEALEELTEWELGAMRDPRNWVRPAAALVVGTAAGTALVLLQVRRGRRQRAGLRGLAEQGGKELLGAVEWTRGRIR
jgi:hypothetical protein